MSSKSEYCLKIPKLENLCCINCKVNYHTMWDSALKSTYHNKILICRLILYSVRCCIASPSTRNLDCIHIIISKKFYSTKKMQNYLINLKIQFTDPQPVCPKIYAACLKYTFTFKLGPIWNLVGKSFYLNRFNFLSYSSTTKAIECNISFKANDILLQIRPIEVRLSSVNLSYLSLTSGILDNVRDNSPIYLTSVQSRFVYVLPKLTRAKLVSVSKSIPKRCPFKTYGDLRRYWKNMYSYHLPKEQNEILFCEVMLPSNSETIFTYPNICILTEIPEFLNCESRYDIATGFINDMYSNVHSVCGKILKIEKIYPYAIQESTCSLKSVKIKSKEIDQVSSIFNTPNCIMKLDDQKKYKGQQLYLYSKLNMKGDNGTNSTVIKPNQQLLYNSEYHAEGKNAIKLNDIFNLINSEDDDKFNSNNDNEKSANVTSFINNDTTIDNVNNICSYYDLNTKYSQILSDVNSKNMINFKKNDKYLNIKPVKKNVNNTCFDIHNYLLSKTVFSENNFDRLLTYDRNLLRNDQLQDLSDTKKEIKKTNNSQILNSLNDLEYSLHKLQNVKMDFMYILSQSSATSDIYNYNIYKLACIEAATFENEILQI